MKKLVDEKRNDNLLAWAKMCGNISEDVSKHLLGFIPNGLHLLYEHFLKSIPYTTKFFSRPFIEKSFKLLSGITIAQAVIGDVAHFIFWPLGFLVGILVGMVILPQKLRYHGEIGKFLYRLSPYVMGGALLTIFLFYLLVNMFPKILVDFTFAHSVIAAIIGAFLGVMGRVSFFFAVNAVNASHSVTIRKNAQNAKQLNVALRATAKLKIKGYILREAQDIIQQMNGPQAQSSLEAFFKEEYDNFALNTHKKIERHFNYLADRACHGDIQALKRLQELNKKHDNLDLLDVILNRILNNRALAKIKDDVDTSYDRWQYQFLR